MNIKDYNAYIKTKEIKFNKSKHEFDSSNLSKKFIPHFMENYRIQIKDKWGEIHSGYVHITTGWKPAFLLIYNHRCISSPVLLNDSCEIIKVYKEARYAI